MSAKQSEMLKRYMQTSEYLNARDDQAQEIDHGLVKTSEYQDGGDDQVPVIDLDEALDITSEDEREEEAALRDSNAANEPKFQVVDRKKKKNKDKKKHL